MPVKNNYKPVRVSKNPPKKIIIQILPVLLMILAIPIGLSLLTDRTNFFNFAYNRKEVELTKTQYTIPVMTITFIADTNNDGKIDGSPANGYQLNDDDPNSRSNLVKDIRDRITNANPNIANLLEKATIYQGYKNPNAIPALKFKLMPQFAFEELNDPPLDRNRPADYKDSTGKLITPEKLPDYNKILTKYNICDAVDNKGIKEVWIWTRDDEKYQVEESNFSSKAAGDISNSRRYQDDLPLCNKSYTVYNYTYDHLTAYALHDRGHQIEHMLNQWPNRNSTPEAKWKDLLFWGKYVGSGKDHKIHKPGCGWFHIVPNILPDDKRGFYVYPELTYVYNDVVRDKNWAFNGYIEPRMSDCEDWKPDGTGKQKLISCEIWTSYYYPESVKNCRNPNVNSDPKNELAFYLWWMQNLPGYGNDLYDTNGRKLRNWWDYMGDFDNLYKSGTFLYTKEIIDTNGPTILAVAPTQNQKVNGTISIKTSVDDDSGVVSFKQYIDNYGTGKPVKLIKDCGKTTFCFYDYNVDTIELGYDDKPAFFTLVLEAIDSKGNVSNKRVELEKTSGVIPTPAPTPTPEPTHIPTPLITPIPIPDKRIIISAKGTTSDKVNYPKLNIQTVTSKGFKDLGTLTIKEEKEYIIEPDAAFNKNELVRLQFCNESSNDGTCGITAGSVDRNITLNYVKINNKLYNFDLNTPNNEVMVYDRANKEDSISMYDLANLGNFGGYLDGTNSNDPLLRKGKLLKGWEMYKGANFTGKEIYWRGEIRIKVQ